ncbi:hypothetical protein ABIA03_000259 [Bradyrhizobium yuanmingense]|uniref:Mutator family transposase n=1 Tax=Bradyrhizobium yuanmingense TaxID=108015 RepID=A0ABV4G8F5_9BRAD
MGLDGMLKHFQPCGCFLVPQLCRTIVCHFSNIVVPLPGDITPAGSPATGAVDEAFAEVRASFDRFCLAAGIEALGTMMEADVTAACGPRHGRDAERRAHRWGRTRGRIGFHGGKIEVERPRVRGVDGREVTIPSWETAAQEDWLGRWAMNLMLINVSTRRFGRAVRLPERDVPAPPGSGGSKSAASRRFVALSAARLADFMAADLSALDLLVVQIDGLHLGDEPVSSAPSPTVNPVSI